MPIPAAVAPALIAAGGSAANTAGGIFTNRANRKFAEKMYEKQKADNIALWNMQNEYNSPQAQMQRYEAAGLNKHLIYGQSNTAGSIATPDIQQGQSRNPNFGDALASAASGLLQYYDIKIKQAQYDNLRDQGQVIREDAMLKRAQTEATSVGSARGKFQLDFDSELRDVSAEARRESLRQLKVNTDVTQNRDVREAAITSSNIQEAIERIKSMAQTRAQSRAEIQRIEESIRQMEKDGTIKELDIDLRRQHINPNDPMWARYLGGLLSKLFESENWFSKYFDRPK